MNERFIVRETSPGYRITPTVSGQKAGSLKPLPEILVIDRAYCHRVVWSSWQALTYGTWGTRGRKQGGTPRRWPLTQTRAYAAELAANLNGRDDAA